MKLMVILLLLCVATAVVGQSSAPPDNYEPNNSFATAYPISMGDSVVKNATISGSVGFESGTVSIGPDIDADIFKITLTQGSLFSATAFRWYNGTSEDTLIDKWRWRIFICDTLHNIVCGGTPVIDAFLPHYSGIFYIVVTSMPDIDYPCRYGLSTAEGATPAQESRDIPVTGLQEDTSGYRVATAVVGQPSTTSDNYEPNNSFATAYPISMGDSVVKNATISGSVGFESGTVSIGPDIDVDIFKITLTQGSLFSATAFRWYNGTSEDTLTDKWRWRIFICDTLHNIVCGGTPLIGAFLPHYSGIFYIVVTSLPDIDYPCRYGLSTAERAILAQDSRDIPVTGLQEDTSGYRMEVVFDTPALSVDLTLNEKVGGRVDAKVLLPGDFDNAVNTQGAIKTLRLDADPDIVSSIKTADIVIPYSPADISGFSENSLTVYRLDDTTHQWTKVDHTIDTHRHQIIAHTTHFSIFGVFVGSSTAVTPVPTARPATSGVSARYLPDRRSFAVHIASRKATAVECRLYTIKGACVKKFASSVNNGESLLFWKPGILADGKYVCTVNAGNHHFRETVSITRRH